MAFALALVARVIDGWMPAARFEICTNVPPDCRFRRRWRAAARAFVPEGRDFVGQTGRGQNRGQKGAPGFIRMALKKGGADHGAGPALRR